MECVNRRVISIHVQLNYLLLADNTPNVFEAGLLKRSHSFPVKTFELVPFHAVKKRGSEAPM